MNPVLNPYAPGAGIPPPELADRDALLAKSSIALQRIVVGRFERSLARLFEFPEIGRLDHKAAIQALVVPAAKLNVSYSEEALTEILQVN